MINLELWRDLRNNPRASLKTWDNFSKEIDSFFDLFDSLQKENQTLNTHTTACDIHENDKAFVLTLDMPGVKKEDIQIELQAQMLSIVGRRQRESHIETKDARFHRSERRFGEFRRVFSLPENVNGDHIEANFDNGVLSIALPKVEKEQAKRITIGENKEGFFQRLNKPRVEEVKKHSA